MFIHRVQDAGSLLSNLFVSLRYKKMSEILETLESNGQLGKVLYELLEQVATSAVLKANEKDKMSSSMGKDQALPLCKSVPILSGDNKRYIKV